MYYINTQVMDTAQPVEVDERNFPHIWNAANPAKKIYLERRGNHIFVETLSNDVDFICSEIKRFEKRFPLKEKKEQVYLDLQALFDSLGGTDTATTEYGYEIERSTSGGRSDYYDLRKRGENLYRCCDGEDCTVISREDNRIRLLSNFVDSAIDAEEFYFDLSEDEYKIASGKED